mgnify:CR=1 FL=1
MAARIQAPTAGAERSAMLSARRRRRWCSARWQGCVALAHAPNHLLTSPAPPASSSRAHAHVPVPSSLLRHAHARRSLCARHSRGRSRARRVRHSRPRSPAPPVVGAASVPAPPRAPPAPCRRRARRRSRCGWQTAHPHGALGLRGGRPGRPAAAPPSAAAWGASFTSASALLRAAPS